MISSDSIPIDVFFLCFLAFTCHRAKILVLRPQRRIKTLVRL